MPSQTSDKLTYVFDLDGTICTQEKSGEYHLARPHVDVIEKIRSLKKDGHRIVIYTARGMKTYGNVDKAMAAYSFMTSEWLSKHDVPHDELKFGKPAGDVYIDDKGVNLIDFMENDGTA